MNFNWSLVLNSLFSFSARECRLTNDDDDFTLKYSGSRRQSHQSSDYTLLYVSLLAAPKRDHMYKNSKLVNIYSILIAIYNVSCSHGLAGLHVTQDIIVGEHNYVNLWNFSSMNLI